MDCCSRMTRICLPPLGVPTTAEGAQKKKAWEAARERMKRDPTLFPKTMSFEAWCAMTSFDVRHANGGPHFPNLMGYLLTGGLSFGERHAPQFDTSYPNHD
eukprot:scaffold119785_cov23-Tisochrysis_lutea.AAC.1